MRAHLVVRILLDEKDHDEVYPRLAELVGSAGVAAWQVDRYEHDELCGDPWDNGPAGEAVAELEAMAL